MDVFISWSGDRSKAAAEALRNWLPKIINAVRPWLSSADIDKGARWSVDVAAKLEASKVGILCLTPNNVHSDWVLFEAGALSKTLQNTYVCPLLFDLGPSDIKGPLAQFQATRANKEEVKKLLGTINSALGEHALATSHIDEAFEMWWPRLEASFTNLPAEHGATKPGRSDREILDEILALVRSEARAIQSRSDPERMLAFSELHNPVKRWERAINEVFHRMGIEVQGAEFLREDEILRMKVQTSKGRFRLSAADRPMPIGTMVAKLRRQIEGQLESADGPNEEKDEA